MKAVILGAGGQLASDLVRAMRDWELVALRHADLDIRDHASVRQRLLGQEPDVVINTAAFHRVDDCEVEIDKAFQVNAFAVRNLALVCAKLNCALVHISTDYVFSGDKRTPYTEQDSPHPLSVYGVSKLAGEYFVRSLCPKHIVVRSSGLYGVAGASGKGGNFVETMLRMAREGKPLRVVSDQVFTPTSTRSLAATAKRLVEQSAYGLFHVTDQGECSWYDFAVRIFECVGVLADLRPISSEAYGATARRPPYSVMDHQRILSVVGDDRPHWVESLRAYLVERGHL